MTTPRSTAPAPSEPAAPADPAHNLASLSEALGVPLPPGTRVLWVDKQSGLDDLVRAKLEMSRDEFQQIAGRLPLQEAELRAGAGRLGTDHGKWDPHATKGLRSGQAQLEGARYLNLGLADDGQGRVTLFVVNHGT